MVVIWRRVFERKIRSSIVVASQSMPQHPEPSMRIRPTIMVHRLGLVFHVRDLWLKEDPSVDLEMPSAYRLMPTGLVFNRKAYVPIAVDRTRFRVDVRLVQAGPVSTEMTCLPGFLYDAFNLLVR